MSPPGRPVLPPSTSPLRLLVSVRDEAEARTAAKSGIDLIDLKEPAQGALGGLPVAQIAALVRLLREDAGKGAGEGAWRPVSATVGDWTTGQPLQALLDRVVATAAAGVDWVKVGLEPAMPQPSAVLAALAGLAGPSGRVVPVLPVLIVDDGLDLALLRAAAEAFPVVMLDTADKRGGSLLERLPEASLRRAVDAAHHAGAAIGLAGALRVSDLPALQSLGADFAGFRSAVCAGDRRGGLEPALLAALQAAAAALPAPGAGPVRQRP